MAPPSITRQTPFEELPDLLRVEQVARWADVSRGVVYTMVETGALPSVRFGRLVRIPRSELAKLIGRDKTTQGNATRDTTR